jgi:hypothetical protein
MSNFLLAAPGPTPSVIVPLDVSRGFLYVTDASTYTIDTYKIQAAGANATVTVTGNNLWTGSGGVITKVPSIAGIVITAGDFIQGDFTKVQVTSGRAFVYVKN